MIALDASAILASLWKEPGWEAVDAALDEAAMSTVNHSEALAKLIERGTPEPVARAMLIGLDLKIVPFDQRQSEAAALMWAPTRRQGLSLGDRACLALAQVLAIPVLTADRAWAELDLGIEIRLIR